MTILSLYFNDKKLQDYDLANGQQLTIGRNPDNDIIIDNPAVSGHHARVESVASSFIVRDLGSTNGVFINQQRLESHVLHHDDIVMIGKHKLIFNVIDSLSSSCEGDPEDSDSVREVFFEDKTRFLDTRAHRELIKKTMSANTKGSSETTAQDNLKNEKGFFVSLWQGISRFFTRATR